MIDLIKDWVLGVAAAAFITGIASSFVPKGKLRRMVSLVCGFMTVAVMLGPLKDFDIDSYSSFLAEFSSQTENYGENIEKENERLLKAIIEERSAAYILDKATQLGIENFKVTVDAKAGDGDYPYPWSAELGGEATEQQRRSLGRYIESELGIPAERQHWSE
jgi:LPS O-antigen subunit length determinant protein (WzzB/FepE family)